MTRRVLVAAFEEEGALLRALAHARGTGHEVLEVHAPYPVHGLPEAQGLRPSRLPWACLAGGLVGLAAGTALEIWTSAFDWPLNVGGKPLLSLPAFVPVAFELTILLAGLGVVLAFFLAERDRKAPPRCASSLRATDDAFLLSLAACDATFDAEELGRLYRERYGAFDVEEVLVEETP